MSTAQASAQAVEVCFRTKGTRRQAFVRPQGSRQWQGWSVPRADVAIKRGSITTLIVIGQRIDHPETDALQRSADISNDLAAEHAAQHAFMASKDRP